MAFLKPQSPLVKGNDYFYPLTTADQVIMDGGYRLDQIVGKVEKSTVTLYQNGWSAAAPYSYSIVVNGLADDLNMQVFPHYSEDFAEKQVLKEEFAKVSFCSRQGNIVTFECWDEIPNMDISIDIEINILYPLEAAVDMDQLESQLPKLNYSIVGSITEPTSPIENMIWVNTDVEITSHVFNKNEPKNPIEGMIWIYIGNTSNVNFYKLKYGDIGIDEVYPISAKQYVSGAWVDVTAMSYQGGEWVEWYVWNGGLFDNGDQFEKITGGWARNSKLYFEYSGKNTGTVEVGNIIKLKAPASACAIATTVNKIDLTEFNTLKATETEKDGFYVIVHSITSGDLQDNYIATSEKSQSGTANIDITAVTGEYYISAATWNDRNAYIPKISLLK